MSELAVSVGILILFLACMVLAAYIVFFPLVRTIMGGIRIFRTYAVRRYVTADLEKAFGTIISDPELGLTMADGGEKTKKGKESRPVRRIKNHF